MTEQESIADWMRMYKSLTDPDVKEKAKREAERKERAENKKKDTGL